MSSSLPRVPVHIRPLHLSTHVRETSRGRLAEVRQRDDQERDRKREREAKVRKKGRRRARRWRRKKKKTQF
jgi:hypothetical protein